MASAYIGIVERPTFEPSKIEGEYRLFHDATNAKIACVAMAGFISGSTMVLKILNSPAPSIRPASIISIERLPSMYCFMK